MRNAIYGNPKTKTWLANSSKYGKIFVSSTFEASVIGDLGAVLVDVYV
jgi:hypothetical protein